MKNFRLIGIITLIVQIILYAFLSQYPDWIEANVVPYIFKPISKILRFLTGWLSFSVGLVFVYGLTVFLIYRLGKSIIYIIKRKTRFKSFLLNVLAWASPVYLFYMCTWGFLYHRKPVHQVLKYDTSPVNKEELKSLCEDLVAETNQLRKQIPSEYIDTVSHKEIFKKAALGFKETSKQYPFLYFAEPQSLKMATGSKLIAFMGAGGIYTFWSGEANVNKIHANHNIPYVALHEMAHQVGVASEDEASYVSWIVSKNHPDLLFQYSANYNVVWRSLRRLWSVDSTAANLLYGQLDSLVYRDAEIENKRWKPYRNLVAEYVVSPFYNFFLKANGREEGAMSYDMVIDLILFERRKALSDFPVNP